MVQSVTQGFGLDSEQGPVVDSGGQDIGTSGAVEERKSSQALKRHGHQALPYGVHESNNETRVKMGGLTEYTHFQKDPLILLYSCLEYFSYMHGNF